METISRYQETFQARKENQQSKSMEMKTSLQIPDAVISYFLKVKKSPILTGQQLDVAELKLLGQFASAVQKEFNREGNALIKFLDESGAFEGLEKYARKAHPELYEKSLTVEQAIDMSMGHIDDIEKTQAQDIKEVNKWIRGWDKNVKPERMKKVLGTWTKKATELGGNKALNELGITMAFNLKNPQMIKELAERGSKITGKISRTTMKRFRKVLHDGYMKEGLTVQGIKKNINGMFKETYKNRSRAIARTEAGIAQGRATYTTYGKNGVKVKRWLPKLDNVTRESHINAMQEGAIPFDNLFRSTNMRYPLDPSGDPAEVVNCRCTLTGSIQEDARPTQPWTGQAIERPPRLPVNVATAYGKPVKKGGIGFAELMTLPKAKYKKVTSLIEAGKDKEALRIMAKASGKTRKVLAEMEGISWEKAKKAFMDCKGLK